jgi:hypothetical protein
MLVFSKGDEFMPQVAASTKSIQEKLQVKPGRSFLLLNPPPGYNKLFGKLPSSVTEATAASKEVDVIQIFVDSRKQLEKELPKLKSKVAPKGMIWITYPKGTSAKKSDINRDSIAEYAASIGLEGVAICAIDDDWSALRLKVV